MDGNLLVRPEVIRRGAFRVWPGRTIPPLPDHEMVVAEARRFATWLTAEVNRECDGLAMVDVSAELLERGIREDYGCEWGSFCEARAAGQTSPGQIHRPQHATGASILKHILLHYYGVIPGYTETNLFAVQGSVQAGKSGAINWVQGLGFILTQIIGVPHIVLHVQTGKNGHFAQAVESGQQYRALFEKMSFRAEPLVELQRWWLTEPSAQAYDIVDTLSRVNPTLRNYNEVLQGKFFGRLWASNAIAAVDQKESRLYSAYAEKKLISPDEHARQMQQRSKSMHRISDVERICHLAAAHGVVVVITTDEMHFGAGTTGLINHFTRLARDLGHIFLGFSATPYHVKDMERFVTIPHYIGPGYVGPTWAKPGVRFKSITNDGLISEAETIKPDIRKFSDEVARLSPRVPYPMSWKIYNSKDILKFRNNLARAAKKGSDLELEAHVRAATNHELKIIRGEYNEMFEMVVSYIIEDWLIHDRDHATGIVIRPGNKNEKMEHFLEERIRNNLDDSIFLNFYHQGTSNAMSISKFIETACRGEDRIVLGVTGAGRMADVLPTRHNGKKILWGFIDFAEESSSLACIEQGAHGRICGYNKVVDGHHPMVIVSDYNHEVLEHYYETGRSLISPIKDTVAVVTGEKVRKRTFSYVDALWSKLGVDDRPKNHPFQIAKRYFQQNLDGRRLPPNDNLMGFGGGEAPGMWEVALPDAFFDAFETLPVKTLVENFGVEQLDLLRFGETGTYDNGETYSYTPKMGIRQTGENNRSHGNHTSDRKNRSYGGKGMAATDRNKKEHTVIALIEREDFVKNPDPGRYMEDYRWWVRGLVLRLSRPHHSLSKYEAARFLPKNTTYDPHLTETEREERDACKKCKK